MRRSPVPLCLMRRILPVLVILVPLRAAVAAVPPAGVDNAIYGEAPLVVQFNASPLGLSGDLAYRWEFGDGAASLDPAPLHSYAAPGQFTARLTVTSTAGGIASRTVPISLTGLAASRYPRGDVDRDCKVTVADMLQVRRKLGTSAAGDLADLNGDGKIDIVDLLIARNNMGRQCSDSATPAVQPAETPAPSVAPPDWEYSTMWEEIGITTPKSTAGPFAQRTQLWDLGETIPLTFSGNAGRPQGTVLAWTCAIRNYWGELIRATDGTAAAGSGGAVSASASWTADRVGLTRIEFRCGSAHAVMWVAVIRPIGSLWDSPANPFGGMGQHPGYEEYGPYLDLQKRIGMKTLRVPLLTDVVAPTPTTVDTAYLDSAIGPLAARGFRGYLLLTYFPGWMTANGTWKPEWASADARADWFATMVGKVVAYAKTKGIKHYEIWNEPNLGEFWGWGAASYCELLRKCYLAAKAADPGCLVINGGLPSPPGAFNGEIGKLLIDGACRPYYDILAGHYYRGWGGYSPEHPNNAMNSGFKQAVARANAAGKPTWDTESDYGYLFQNEWESMNWYTRQMSIMLAAGVRQITQYNFCNAKEKLGYTSTWWFNFYGMISNHQIPTFSYDAWPSANTYQRSADCFVYTPLPRLPAYAQSVHELANAAGWLEAALPDNNMAFVYTVGGSVRATCWRGGEDQCAAAGQCVRGLMIGLQPVAVRDVFGNDMGASAVIPLGPSPVYVEFGNAVTASGVKAALEAGTLQASPEVFTASFNPKFIAEKLLRKNSGMPRKWYVLGPISDSTLSTYNATVPAELVIAPDAGAVMGGTAYGWSAKAATFEANSSKIDLNAAFAPDNANKTAILYAVFSSPTARRGRVHYMASANVRMWVNGLKIADEGPRGQLEPNRYAAPGNPDGWGIYWGVKPGLVDIRPGRNIVVVKIHGTGGQFGMFFRIAWENFETMTDLAW